MGALLTDPHLGKSPLGAEFVNTRGFSIVFRRSALEEVKAHFPYLAEFLTGSMFPASNAFYVNPLVLEGTSRVDTHVDCRLVASQNVRIIPNLVSVLYVEVDPSMLGGDLVLQVEPGRTFAIRPSTNDLLHFLGTLVHSVTPVESPSRRISVVCEQYNLPEEVLEGFPEFQVICDNDVAPRVSMSSAS
ncbi:MAG: 2OG-Fe(II) oxygenase [Myxococcota bacterium]